VRALRRKPSTCKAPASFRQRAYATTSELASSPRRNDFSTACVISYGDVSLQEYVLDEVLETSGDFVVQRCMTVDAKRNRRKADLAILLGDDARKTLLQQRVAP
jgi:hypothetical protein